MKFVALDSVPEEGVSHDPEIRKRVLLRRGDLPHLTNFARARLLPGHRTTAHAHADMSEVFMVESGSGLMLVAGREVELRPGVCVAVEPGEAHEVSNNGGAELVLLYFGVEA
ncbi:MAG TPA: cupin domain-containing protein [Pyrinomonadaceae bacterium]|nr:cupin domain-containing protein [Pyrinomonadaceae bacterium]